MKNAIWLIFFYSIMVACLSAQDIFSGKYLMENQAEYDSDKKWIEITRNKYQEIIINSDTYTNLVAYYDESNNELFYLIERQAQYNTLMKIKIINNKKIELYMLDNKRWQKYPYFYTK
jgi:hypothetical protein